VNGEDKTERDEIDVDDDLDNPDPDTVGPDPDTGGPNPDTDPDTGNPDSDRGGPDPDTDPEDKTERDEIGVDDGRGVELGATVIVWILGGELGFKFISVEFE
jgi:hypothetical protein